MSKMILRAELKRLRQYSNVFAKLCPVCEVSWKMKGKYKPTYCCSNDRQLTACSPSVQKRCKKIMNAEEKMGNIVFEAICRAREELEEL